VNYEEHKKLNLPDLPGVYRFVEKNCDVLYVGKATSLRERTRSYFSNDVLKTRGKHILDMVTRAHSISYEVTDSVLEALILEAALIKRFQPYYNTKEKDDKSFNYVVITNEEFPRILTIRERTMHVGKQDSKDSEYAYTFGPFPSGTSIREGLKIVRKIFPYRDTCTPGQKRPCFNRQIGLCPGVCTGEISAREYKKQLQQIRLFFEGKKKTVISMLKKQMYAFARKQEFELAQEVKRKIFSLEHMNDVTLLDNNIINESKSVARIRRKPIRIEAYDVAHISGKYTVGVMTVVEDGVLKKSEYRKFKLRILPDKSDDILHLGEILDRRFKHKEWNMPDIAVLDGGVAQKRKGEQMVHSYTKAAHIVSVVKDERHKPKAILGKKEIVEQYKKEILLANAEAHRFALAYHRTLREKLR
jgi:excinuclease ABC subunit C